MSGAHYFTLVLAVVTIVALVLNPLFALIPVFVGAALLALMWFGRGARDARVTAGPGPAVPTSRDAAYDPAGDGRRTGMRQG